MDIDTGLFHRRLDALGIADSWDAYGPGTHSWRYWARDLRQVIGPVMADFADPPAPPAAVTYTSASAQYSQFGWQVTMHRPAEEFSTLEDADAAGFSLAGSGSATVVTPPLYRPGGIYHVVETDGGALTASVAVADDLGRLQVEVALGPGNPYQQYTAAAAVAGTHVYRATVRIGPL